MNGCDKMSKYIIVSKIFYVIAIIAFITYLCTSKSAYMMVGGLSLIMGSLLVIMDKKKNE